MTQTSAPEGQSEDFEGTGPGAPIPLSQLVVCFAVDLHDHQLTCIGRLRAY